jgi:putative PIG3 family NAD(P)H quinone oxidoreductase
MLQVMRAIAIENPGSEYRLITVEMPKPVPGPGEVLVKVAAAGLNHADINQAQGQYPPPPGAPDTLGMEISGTIEAVGAEVTGVKPGDAVCALLAGGGYAEYALAPAQTILPLPAGVTLIDAAALPEVHFTVWTNLMDAARLKPGERVLVHGGSSGIGTAAIQLLAALGHDVFATAGSDQKCAACEALGAKRAINYKTEDFVSVTKDATGGKGVDVILDMVGGDYIQRNMSAAAVWGRIVNIGFQSGFEARINFAPLLVKRLTLAGTTLRGRSLAEKGAIRDALAHTVWPLVEQGRIRPIVDSTFPLAEAGQAHARMQESRHIGKILLVP